MINFMIEVYTSNIKNDYIEIRKIFNYRIFEINKNGLTLANEHKLDITI